MKSKSLFLIVLVAFFATARSEAQEKDPVQLQMKLIRDAIQLMTEKIQVEGVPSTFQNADFQKKAVDFEERSKKQLDLFMSEMEGILAEVGPFIQSYEAVLKSGQYTDAERKSLLVVLRRQLDALAARLSRRYRKAIVDLYRLVDVHFVTEFRKDSGISGTWLSFRPILSNGVELSETLFTDYGERVPGKRAFSRFLSTAFQRLLKSKVLGLENLMTDCYTSSCYALTISSRIFWSDLVTRLLNKDLTFHLTDGNAVTVYGMTRFPFLNKSGSEGFIGGSIQDVIQENLIGAQNARIADALRIDIGQDRFELMEKILPTVSVPDFELGQCQAKMKEIKSALCQLSSYDCLSQEELQLLSERLARKYTDENQVLREDAKSTYRWPREDELERAMADLEAQKASLKKKISSLKRSLDGHLRRKDRKRIEQEIYTLHLFLDAREMEQQKLSDELAQFSKHPYRVNPRAALKARQECLATPL